MGCMLLPRWSEALVKCTPPSYASRSTFRDAADLRMATKNCVLLSGTVNTSV